MTLRAEPWHGVELPVLDTADGNGRFVYAGVTPVAPVGPLRVAAYPYPHLRDDEGAILARDVNHPGKMAWILAKCGAL